jgi:mono/diheme cytochrome c family protein
VPHPADLTAARMSAEHLDATLWNGVPGTAMPSQRDLSALDRKALAAFVRSLGPAQAPPPAAAATVALGADLFAIRCSSCHGEAADGTGPARARFARPPADFSRKQPTRARIEQVLTRGIPGSAMTPMRRLLSDAELDALVAYVQSVYGHNLATGKDEAAAP